MPNRRNPGARAGDFTGREKARLAEENAAKQAAAAQQMALATAAAAPQEQEAIDLKPRVEPSPSQIVGDVAVTDVDVDEPIMKFRVNETLEMVTIGYGNHYDFVQGQEYRAPKHIYDYLDERGFVWH